MHFVDKDVRDTFEVGITAAAEAGEHDSGRAEQGAAPRSGATLASDRIPDQVVSSRRLRRGQILAAFLGNSRCDSDG